MAAPRAAAPPSGPAKAYMTLYNVAQFLGWSYIMFCTVTALRAGGGPPGVWQVRNSAPADGMRRHVMSHASILVPSFYAADQPERLVTASSSSRVRRVPQAVEMPLKIFQTAAVLEVGYSLLQRVLLPLQGSAAGVNPKDAFQDQG